MKEFALNTNIVFTPEATAVLAQEIRSDSRPRRFATSCAVGDLVVFPRCESLFRVTVREWTIGEEFETLTVLLSLEPGPPPLRVVS